MRCEKKMILSEIRDNRNIFTMDLTICFGGVD